MVKLSCKGWVVNNEQTDKLEEILKRKQRKLRHLKFIFGQDHSIQIHGRLSPSISSVLSNEDIMEKIFDGLPCTDDKSNVVVACKTWARMFLLHPAAPKWNAHYNRQLQRELKDDIMIVSRGSITISQRCRCYLTQDEIARTMLHICQHALEQCTHLKVIECPPEESDGNNFNELPRKSVKRTKKIASMLLGWGEVFIY